MLLILSNNYNRNDGDDDDDDDDNNNNNNNNNKWNVKTRVITVIIGATGTISKSFRKYVSDIPGNHDVKELQKTAILGTAHIRRKMLTSKNNRTNAGTRHRGTINNKE